MKRPPAIGLTGGLGAGKSTVASLLRRRGITVLDADAVVREALEPGGAAHARVVRLLGPGIMAAGGRLDRRTIAARIFRDRALRRKLENILHPIVGQFFRREAAARRRGPLVLDVPLLFESGLDRRVDKTVVVWAPWSTRLRRLVRSGRLSAPDARLREKAQMPLAQKRRRANFVINNSGSLNSLSSQVAGLAAKIRSAKIRSGD